MRYSVFTVTTLMYAYLWLTVVDTSKAGQGDLDVHVSCNNVRVPSQLQLLPDGSRYNCSFVPATAQQHSVHVTYNKEPVPGKYLDQPSPHPYVLWTHGDWGTAYPTLPYSNADTSCCLVHLIILLEQSFLKSTYGTSTFPRETAQRAFVNPL